MLDASQADGIIRTPPFSSRPAPPFASEERFAITSPTTIPRHLHNVSRANISENALKVLYRLKNSGFQSYLVGGGVRDLLLGREPKDFDVVTDARPDQVRQLFRNCRLIGRRFRLAHVRFGREVIEVATFRARTDGTDEGDRVTIDGRIVRDNVYGTIEEDAWRRDFTVNCLYYDIRDFSVADFADGMADLESGMLRLLGEPEVRLREDPVRMLRAIRFSAKLGFRIHPDIEYHIPRLAGLLADVPAARLYEEVLKLFHGGAAVQSFELLRHYNMFGSLFPETESCLSEEQNGFPRMLVARALSNTDERITEGKPVTPAFLLAVLLWEPMRRLAQEYEAAGMSRSRASEAASTTVIAKQLKRVAIPRRFGVMAQEIWAMQARLKSRHGRRPMELLRHPRFRAAYDFLLLRSETGEEGEDLARWWTQFQNADEGQRRALLEPSPSRRRRRPPRRRGGRRSLA